jgi:hypothetical protein
MPKRPRNYKREYASYHKKPAQKKRRAQRNASRAAAAKRGAVRKGDGKEVHHTSPRGKKGSLGKKTRVVSRATNRRIGHPKKGRKKA